MKFVFASDSFKGTLSSAETGELLCEAAREAFPGCECRCVVMADGGEGSTAAILSAAGGKLVSVRAHDPLGGITDAFYGVTDDGRAVVETAAASGLALIPAECRDVRSSSSFGTGELLARALDDGHTDVTLALGGSATNDGGCGAAAAFGVRFYNKAGEEFVPTGGTLIDIDRIDMSGRSSALDGVEVVTMCDIDNPMYGPTGASHIFGPQKGADSAMVEELDRGVIHLCEVIRRDLGMDLSEVPGGGAAGAMGAGMIAFFGSRLQMGIETVLDTVGFDQTIGDADLILTGEGKIDGQSLRGKVVIGVARRAARQGKPVVAVVGGADYDVEPAYGEGVTAIFPINRLPQDFSVIRAHSRENLTFAMDNIVRMLKAFAK